MRKLTRARATYILSHFYDLNARFSPYRRFSLQGDVITFLRTKERVRVVNGDCDNFDLINIERAK